MKRFLGMLLTVGFLAASSAGWADNYTDTIKLFKNAGESKTFFANSYGYAVFPTIGKGGLVVGGAHGSGHVYAKGVYVGDASMTQVTVGFQAGGQAYSQIIFFEDKRSFDEFTNGNFEFGAGAQAVVATAAAQGQAGTTGASAGASASNNEAATAGNYYKGLATFIVTKGGLIAGVSIGGQKFSYTRL